MLRLRCLGFFQNVVSDRVGWQCFGCLPEEMKEDPVFTNGRGNVSFLLFKSQVFFLESSWGDGSGLRF